MFVTVSTVAPLLEFISVIMTTSTFSEYEISLPIVLAY